MLISRKLSDAQSFRALYVRAGRVRARRQPSDRTGKLRGVASRHERPSLRDGQPRHATLPDRIARQAPLRVLGIAAATAALVAIAGGG